MEVGACELVHVTGPEHGRWMCGLDERAAKEEEGGDGELICE